MSRTFHVICYLVLNGGGAMHAWYGCACLPICQIRQRRIYAESDVAIDRHIRIMHAWPHHHFNTKITNHMKSLDVFHAGITEVWILWQSISKTVLPYLAVLNLLLEFIPQQSLQGIRQDFPYDLLFGIKWWVGAMHKWYGGVCQWQHQIRHRFGAAESGILADRHIHIMRAWPHHHLIPNNKSYGKFLTYSMQWLLRYEFWEQIQHCQIWQYSFKMTIIEFIPQQSLHGIRQNFPYDLLFGIKWWRGHARMIWMCLSANIARFGSTESMPNLMLPLTKTHPYHLCMAPPPFNTK